MEEKNIFTLRKNYTHKDSGSVFLWALILPYAFSFLALIVLFVVAANTNISVKELSESTTFTIISSILTPIIFLSLFLIYNKIQKVSIKASRLNFKLNYKTILILIAISIICVFGLQYFIGGINLGLESLGYNVASTELPLTDGWWYALNILILAFLPAICEELIFRGVILNGLSKNCKDGTAVILSALLFALMHGRLEQFVYPFILGIILGIIVLRTRNIVASMIVHFCNNLIVITLGFVEKMTGFSFMPQNVWLFWTLAFVLIFVTFGLLFVIDKFYFKKHQEQSEAYYQKELNVRVPNLIMIVGIVIAGVLFIVNLITGFMN